MPKVDWLITELNVKGGAESFVYRTVPYLTRCGWQIRVITLMTGGDIIRKLSQTGIPCIELGLTQPSTFRVLSRLNSLWSDSPPEILHTHLYHAGIIGRIMAKKVKIPVILVHQHGLEQNRSFARTFLDRKLNGLVTQYVVSCEAVSKQLQAREQIPGTKISIIYNGVQVKDEFLSQDIVSNRINLPNGIPPPFIVGCVGRLEPEKGHEDLLFGFSRLNSGDTPQPNLWLFGDGSLKERLISLARELHIEQQVHFFGAQETVASYYPGMDLFILPSKWEGLSLALLEAMSQGIPVIATNVGGTPEVITDHYNGILIPPNDPLAIKQAIEYLKRDPQLRKELGLQGKSHVAANFTLNNTVRAIDDLYKRWVT